jgi:DNA-directed RNA polymerase beta subunit
MSNSKQEKISKLKEYFKNMKLDASVMGRTLGAPSTYVTPQLLVDASKKLLDVFGRKVDADDRDNVIFSKFLGPEDYIKEHIEHDAGKIQLKAKSKLRQKRNLGWLHAGFFSPQIKSVFVGNSLAQNIEGVNPMEQYMLAHKVTKMGSGGIGSTEAIPDSSREVNESQFGLLDPIQTVEATTIGVVNFFVHNLRKGVDGKIYRQVIDNATGKPVWIDHQEFLSSTIDIPEH